MVLSLLLRAWTYLQGSTNRRQRKRAFFLNRFRRLTLETSESRNMLRGTVSVVATDSAAAEQGNDTGTLTFTRTGDSSTAITINVSYSGTATQLVDYNAVPFGNINMGVG